MTQGYQGWTNHSTWALMLAVNNDAGMQKSWRTFARNVWKDRGQHHPPEFTRSEATRFALADQLKDDFEAELERAQERVASLGALGGLWQDFLRSAFDDVTWAEAADSILRDCELAEYEGATFLNENA